jgi:phospholipid-binding lipoprotein MlaA
MTWDRQAAGAGVGALLIAAMLGGCNTDPTVNKDDDFEGMNRAFYKFNDALDKHIIKPVAEEYVKVTPQIIRTGVTNFFYNMDSPNVILNDILQGKLKQAWDDTGRFITNSTIGVGGLFDPASGSGLIRHEEDLGQTFGKWGMGEIDYLVIPLVGPNSVRDAPDLVTSALLSPLYYASFVVTFPLGALNAINTRANLLDASRIVEEAALDPYSFVREAYRQNRIYKIYDGNPPIKVEEENLDTGETGVLHVY